MDAQLTDVLGLPADKPIKNGGGLAEDAVPYVANDDSVIVLPQRRKPLDPWLVRSNALDRVGILPGDVIEVDPSPETCENLKPLDKVIVQHMHADPNVLLAVTLLRQFVPPSLLVSNSSGKNDMPLDLERDEVHVRGVIVAVHRSVRGT